MENLVFLIIMIPLAAFFTGIGVYAMRRKKPMWFYSGSEVKPWQIRDIPAYNRANGKMWKQFSVPFWMCGVLAIGSLWADWCSAALAVVRCFSVWAFMPPG